MLTKCYNEKKKADAQICIIHGLGEHSGRYLGMAKMLAEQGLDVFALDLRGYGLTGGGRAQGSLTDFFSDIQKMLGHVSNDLPLFMMGHSMGAGIIIL
jgi:acylglycerol lipase